MTAPRTPAEPRPTIERAMRLVDALVTTAAEDERLGTNVAAPLRVALRRHLAALATPLAVQATDEREAFERAMGLATPKRREEWFALPRVQEAWRIWRAARAQLAQAPAALSDEQKRLMYRAAAVSRSIHPDDYHRGILDAERAHGIGISHKEKDE